MVTINKTDGSIDTHNMEYYGLTTDEKPVFDYLPNGSMFYEMDTQDIYMFDKENKVWIKQ